MNESVASMKSSFGRKLGLGQTSDDAVTLQFANTLVSSDGGPARYAYELYAALQRQRESAYLFHFSKLGPTVIASESPGIAPSLRTSFFRGVSLLRRVICTTDNGRVILHGYYLWWVPLLVFLLPSKWAVVIIPHGSLTVWQGGIHPRRKRYWNNLFIPFYRSRGVTFATASHREKAEIESQFRGMEISVVGMGISLPDYCQTDRLVTRDNIKLLSLSRIAEKKRIDRCIETLSWLRARGIEAKLTVVGDGRSSLRHALIAMVQRLDLSEHVTFEGEIVGQAKWDMYGRHDVFLLPSEDENFGVTVAEASGLGVSVLATSHVDAAVLLAGPGVVALNSWSEELVVESILKLAEYSRDPNSGLLLADRTRRLVSWDRVVHALEGHFKS